MSEALAQITRSNSLITCNQSTHSYDTAVADGESAQLVLIVIVPIGLYPTT